jgi:molybdenum cofactor guanylyltransferase
MIGVMDARAADVAAFILAGGKSARMGTDKAFVMFEGRTLLDRALDLARSVAPNVRIVGKPDDAVKFQDYGPIVEDVFRDCGPLAGIHAALRLTTAELNVMLAVDVPFVSRELLEFLIFQARSRKAMVTVAEAGGRLHPLSGVYRPAFAAVAEQALRAGRYRIDALFADARAQIVREAELRAAGFSAAMFCNLNTREELEQATREQVRN